MGNTNGTISYQSIYVNSGTTASIISATTISANTFYGGSLSASFIGNGDVNDQEFIYISGITSDTQTQINQKVSVNTNFLTYTESQNLIPLSKKLEGINIELNETQNEIEVSLPFNQTLFKQYFISVSSVLSSTAVTNFNLSTLFNDSNRAVQIVITQGNAVISGISGGTDGSILMITNTGTGLIILENESTKCTPNNSIKFKFTFGEAFFLTYRKTIFLIYNSSEQCWKNINFGASNNQYDYVNDFNDLFDYSTANTDSGQYNGLIPHIGMQSNIGTASTINNVVRTNFLDSNHVLKISLPQNTASTSSYYVCLHKANRADNYFESLGATNIFGVSEFNLYKFSLTSTTFNSDYCFTFGFTIASSGNRLKLNASVSSWGFRTPISTDTLPLYFQTGTVTQSDTSPLYELSFGSTSATSLLLSSCINSWCYAGIYSSTITTQNSNLIFITSINGNEYTIDRVEGTSSGNQLAPFSILRSKFGSTNTNSIFIDTYNQIDSGTF